MCGCLNWLPAYISIRTETATAAGGMGAYQLKRSLNSLDKASAHWRNNFKLSDYFSCFRCRDSRKTTMRSCCHGITQGRGVPCGTGYRPPHALQAGKNCVCMTGGYPPPPFALNFKPSITNKSRCKNTQNSWDIKYYRGFNRKKCWKSAFSCKNIKELNEWNE